MTAILRPDASDVRLIGYYLGKVILGLGLLQLVPLAVALGVQEWNSATSFAIGVAVCVLLWALSDGFLATRRALSWAHGMVIVALAWLVGPILASVPMILSGRFSDPLHAFFEAMSGLTTTGMSVIHDLDHTPLSEDLYRHLLQIAGGLGIIIVVLSVFTAGGARITTLYVSEARDERVLPNVIHTARFIFQVASTLFVVFTLALVGALLLAGFSPGRAVYHAVNLFFSSFATGGFSVMQASMIYYHSATVELVVGLVMVAGTLSFGLHLAMWRGDLREVWRHLETRTLALTTSLLFVLLSIGLVRVGAYDSVEELLRKGLFTLVSAASSTGHQVNVGDSYLNEWGLLAPAALVGAMAIGGMASSTAGGIKAIRLGLATKGIVHDIRRLLLPEAALVVSTYHAGRRQVLRDQTVRAATGVLLLFIASYLLGTVVALAYGEADLTRAIFESVSVGSNIGISIGVVNPGLPDGLVLVYALQMWVGRLEFIAAFALLGYVLSLARGRARS
ncbi:MAG: TrkH family potassium uptake protein [Nitriliruptoraceae bacterium]